MPTTLLLAGAPASGKSTLAQALAASGSIATDPGTGAVVVTARTPAREYRFVDAPSASVPHALGASAPDALVLVVSGADGPLPPTRAHVELAASHRIPVAAVYLSAPEGLDVELTDLVELEVRELLTKYGFTGDAVAVIRTDAARMGRGEPGPGGSLRALADALDRFFAPGHG